MAQNKAKFEWSDDEVGNTHTHTHTIRNVSIKIDNLQLRIQNRRE